MLLPMLAKPFKVRDAIALAPDVAQLPASYCLSKLC